MSLQQQQQQQQQEHPLLKEWTLGKLIQTTRNNNTINTITDTGLRLQRELHCDEEHMTMMTSLSTKVYNLVVSPMKPNVGGLAWNQLSSNRSTYESFLMHADCSTEGEQQTPLTLALDWDKLAHAVCELRQTSTVDVHGGEQDHGDNSGGEVFLNGEEDRLFATMANNLLQPLSILVHERLLMTSGTTTDALMTLYGQNLANAMDQPLDMVRWFVDAHVNGKSMFAFTVAVTFFELALYNCVYSTLHFQHDRRRAMAFANKLPKLNDFLQMAELRDTIGDTPAFLLRCLIGPLNSLNLRNLLLHGFVSEAEFSPCYTSLLLLIMADMGAHVKERLDRSTQYRLPVEDMSDKEYGYWEDCEGPILQSAPTNNASITHGDDIFRLLMRSYFVQTPWINSWMESLKHYHRGQYYHCLMYILPVMEHCIRRVFVCSNDCGNRLFTAEKHSLLTSLDILLSTIPVSHLKNRENQIFGELGDRISNMLFDLLIWGHSPRVRDLLCHGAVAPHSVSRVVADRTLATALFIAAHYDINNVDNAFHEEYVVSLPPVMRNVVNWAINKYDPVFHPSNMVSRTLERAFASLMQLEMTVKLRISNNDRSEDGCGDNAVDQSKRVKEMLEMETSLDSAQQYLRSVIHPLIFELNQHTLPGQGFSRQIESVVLPQRTVKKLITMKHIVDECLAMIDKLTESIEEFLSGDQSLGFDRRSRPIRFLLKSLPCLTLGIQWFLSIVSMEHASMKSFDVGTHAKTDASFIVKNDNACSSIGACVKKRKWQRGFECLLSFVIDTTDAESLYQHTAYRLSILNAKESARMYVDLAEHVRTLSLHTRCEDG